MVEVGRRRRWGGGMALAPVFAHSRYNAVSLGVGAMGANEIEGLVRRNRLSAGELAEIEALAAICRRHEGLELQLNFEMLRARPGTETNDFLYYAGGALVGFLEMYGAEVEVIGMVHPGHR